MPGRGSSKSSGRVNRLSEQQSSEQQFSDRMSANTSSFSSHFSTVAPDYDVLLSDVWGVVHNGVAATANACDALAIPQTWRHRRADHQCAAAGRVRAEVHRRPQGAARQLRRDRELRRRHPRADHRTGGRTRRAYRAAARPADLRRSRRVGGADRERGLCRLLRPERRHDRRPGRLRRASLRRCSRASCR